MTIYNAYLIKGYLIDKKAPKRIMEALDTLIGTLHGSEAKPSQVSGVESPPEDSDSTSDEEEESRPSEVSRPDDLRAKSIDQTSPPVKAKRAWSPEAKAAAAERMRAMRAKKKAEGESADSVKEHDPANPDPEPTKYEIRRATASPTPALKEPEANPKPLPPIDPERLITVHRGYAGKREDGTLTDADWPDIKARLARSEELKAIASDYDISEEDLDFFIASFRRREGKSPGEALASPSSVASGATQRRT
jgi:hypothetical protein